MKKTLLIFSFFFLILLSAFIQLTPTRWTKSTPLAKVLVLLGEPKPSHYLENWDTNKAKIGEELFFKGQSTSSNGKKSHRISKHYVCSNCHNTTKETQILTDITPKSRLQYASQTGIPFLQGSTMFGVVNRTQWYNGDYKKKYGDLVIPAQDTLVNAIQLCARECSQGRLLEKWELEALLNYFWSLQITLGDLNFNEEEWFLIQEKSDSAIVLIQSKYSLFSNATFTPALSLEKRTYGENGLAENGKVIYNQSCLHCHHPKQRITNLKLEDNKLSHQLLKSMLKKTSEMSVYEIVRRGTNPIAGYKPYMPHCTQEKLSNQQIEDLVAYINKKCD